MSNTIKKEVEFTPLNSTSVTPKRASLRHKQLYQITIRNFKWINLLKNVVIGILVALISNITEEFVFETWYQIVTFYLFTTFIVAYLLSDLDRLINYMGGGSYE